MIMKIYTTLCYIVLHTKNREVKVYTYNNHICKVTKIQLDNSYLIKKTLRKRKSCYLPYGKEDNINK